MVAKRKSKKDTELTQQGTNEAIGRIIASWDFPEFITYQRGMMWYVIASIVTVALLVYSFFTENNLFMIIIILAAVIFIIANSRHPETVPFAIAEGGIIIKDKFIPYIEIRSFWIIYQPPEVKTLYIEPISFFSPRIQVHLERQSPSEIREVLLQYLDEDLEKEDEPQSEMWGRLFKL